MINEPANPTPGSELFAESARNSGGLPSEETIARAICADDFDFDETVYDTLSPRQQSQFLANARAILALIRPAFEAKEREIERLQEAAEYWPETSASWEARAISAEAALAGLRQCILDSAVICDDDEKAGDRLERLAAAIRASAASNIGQTIGQNEGEKR